MTESIPPESAICQVKGESAYMRVLHTADWHFGRTLEGRSRQTEHEAFVDELCGIVAFEGIQLVLIAGDIFDSVNPPAVAEELYCDALARLSDGGKRAVVVIAGNHDSPDRLCAVRQLAQRHGITMFGNPQEDPGRYEHGSSRVHRVGAGPGWAELAIPGQEESAVVLALPYPSETRLNRVLAESLGDADLQVAYSQRVRQLFDNLARQYRPDAIRLAVSHLYVAGGIESIDSERPIQMGGVYTVEANSMPPHSQYVALGHLHRPQGVTAPVLTRYAGSPLSFSFAESGQVKSVTLLEVAPADQTARSWEIPLTAGRPLVRWVAKQGLTEVERWAAEGRDPDAWIDLQVHLPQSLTMEQTQTLRRMREGFINIRPVFTTAEAEVAAATEQRVQTLEERFIRFYKQRSAGGDPPDAVIRLFLNLAAAGDEEVEA